MVRQGGNVSRLYSSLWHQALPSKISFFMLRLMSGRLSVMDILHKFGVLGPSHCFCCLHPCILVKSLLIIFFILVIGLELF